MAGESPDSKGLLREVALLRRRVRELERELAESRHPTAEPQMGPSEHEGDFRRLMEAIPEMVSRTRPDSTYLYVSPGCTRLFGYQPEELLGCKAHDFIHPEDVPRVMAASERVCESGGTEAGEYRHLTKDGSYVWVETMGQAVLGNKGNGPKDVICVIRDITERKRAEEALEESEARYRALFDAGQDAVFLFPVNADGMPLNFTEVNEMACQMLGYTCEELLTMSPADLVAPEYHEMMPGLGARLIENGHFRAEWEDIAKDGRRIPVDVSVTLFEMNGQPVSMSVVRDITERKRAGEAYRALVDHSLQGLMILQEGRVVFANHAFEQISGYSLPEILAWSPEELQAVIHPEDQALVWTRHRERLLGKVLPERYEMRAFRKDGAVSWVEIQASRIAYAGQPAIQAAFVEITERKEAEKALRESEARFRSIFEKGAIGMMTADRSARILQANPALYAFLGYTEAELVQCTFFDLTHPEDREETARQVRDAQEGRRAGVDLDKRYLRKDGTVVWAHTTAVWPPACEGKPTYSIAMIQDITERKRTEEMLAVHQEQLQSLASELVQTEDRERRHIAAYLHDEVGQSLAAIRVRFAAWKGMKSSLKRRALLSDIEQIIDRTIEETRTLTFELSPPILFELGLGPALEWLGENLCEKAGIAFEFLDDGRSGKLEETLASALYRIARELLLNAVKHAKAKCVSVSVSADDEDISLVVKDDGIGMDPSRYEQALRGAGGTYGLFSIGERLHHLRGSLDIESNPGEGTRVTVAAPLEYSVSSHEGGLA